MTKRDQDKRVLAEFLSSLEDCDIRRFLVLWTEDGVWELPFGNGAPQLEGKAEIEAFVGRLFELFGRIAFDDIRIFPAVEAGLVFSEYRGNMEVRATGRPYRNTYIAKFQLNGGKIASVREYFNPTVVTDAVAPRDSL